MELFNEMKFHIRSWISELKDKDASIRSKIINGLGEGEIATELSEKFTANSVELVVLKRVLNHLDTNPSIEEFSVFMTNHSKIDVGQNPLKELAVLEAVGEVRRLFIELVKNS